MSYDLYVVTDERLSKGLSHLQIAVQAAKGGRGRGAAAGQAHALQTSL